MVGFLPPSSSTTGVRCLAAAVMTIFATAVPPVKKDVVPRLFEQRGRFRNGTEHDRKRFAIEILRKEPRDSFGSCSGYFRRLDDSAVTSGNRCDQRRQCQHQRIIPSPDNQPDSQRIESHFRMGWRHLERCADPNRLHPAPQMSEDVIDLAGHEFHVDQVGVDAISAKIGP
jgi:hypothetical protein